MTFELFELKKKKKSGKPKSMSLVLICLFSTMFVVWYLDFFTFRSTLKQFFSFHWFIQQAKLRSEWNLSVYNYGNIDNGVETKMKLTNIFNTCDFAQNNYFWRKQDLDKYFISNNCDEASTINKVVRKCQIDANLPWKFTVASMVSMFLQENLEFIFPLLEKNEISTATHEIAVQEFFFFKSVESFFGIVSGNPLSLRPDFCILDLKTQKKQIICLGTSEFDAKMKYADYSAYKQNIPDVSVCIFSIERREWQADVLLESFGDPCLIQLDDDNIKKMTKQIYLFQEQTKLWLFRKQQRKIVNCAFRY